MIINRIFSQNLILLLAGLSYFLVGCQLMNRSAESGYGAHQAFGDWDAPLLLSDPQDNFVNQLESRSLQTKAEKEQFYKYKPMLTTTKQKAQFLSRSTIEEREAWIQENNISSEAIEFSERDIAAIEQSDIILGMNKKAVEQSWGKPNNIKISGTKYNSNEQWEYLRYVTSSKGYVKETQVLIFENGKIAGWQRLQ